MMDLTPTPQDKLRWADSLASYDYTKAMDWYEAAALQEDADAEAAYAAAMEAWRAAKPSRQAFLSDAERERLATLRAELKAKAQAEHDKIWGPLLRKHAVRADR